MASTRGRRRRTIRRLATPLIAAGLFVGMASAPANAGSWSFNLKTKDARPGGQTIGTVHYKNASGCYDVWVSGTVKDFEADGWGVFVYISGHKCSGHAYGDREIGYVGGKGKSKPLKGYFKGMKNASVSVCLHKPGYALSYCRDS